MSTRKWIAIASVFAVSAAALALYPTVMHWKGRLAADNQQVTEPPSGVPLSDSEAKKIRELVRTMMNPGDSERAAGELKVHFEQLIADRSAAAPVGMAFALECLAPRFGNLDSGARQLSLALLSDILGWFGDNPAVCWTALLAPSKTILGTAMTDSSEIQLSALKIAASIWDWSPPDVDDAARRKTLGTWKADLHGECVGLLRARDDQVRAAAGLAVIAVAIDTAAAKGLVLLHDPSPAVRRTTLLALSERPTLLSNEEVLSFLRDEHKSVRAAADMVLTARGLTREQIALATRATDPSALVRAQAPRHILESSAVDRVVWLAHLSRDNETPVRAEAARALAHINDPNCHDRLVEMAKNDPDPEIRRYVEELLHAISSETEPKTPITTADAPTPQVTPKAN